MFLKKKSVPALKYIVHFIKVTNLGRTVSFCYPYGAFRNVHFVTNCKLQPLRNESCNVRVELQPFRNCHNCKKNSHETFTIVI